MKRQFYERKPGFSQSYLLGRFVRNVQRPTKVPFFIREIGINPLRWTEPLSVILQLCRRSVSFSLEGEGQDEGGIFGVIHPHPNPLPQAGEGTDWMLALCDSANLLNSSPSERYQN